MRRGPGLWLALGVLAIGGIAALLHSAIPGADAEQARLCRMVLPALYPEEEGIEIVAAEAVTGGNVVVVFRAGTWQIGHQQILCRFGGTGYAAGKRDLLGIRLNGRDLGEAAMWAIRERWLESRFALPADPGPPRARARLSVSRGTALALQHTINALPRMGILALLALATALIYGLLGRINLAFGEFAALGGISTALVVAMLAASGVANPLVAAGVALLYTLALSWVHGAVTGRLILWPLSQARSGERTGQPLLVAGVGLLVALQEGLRLAQGAGTLWLPPVHGEGWRLASGGGFDVIAQPRLVAMTLVDFAAIGVTLLVMRRSAFGRAWRASADDPFAASLMGIDPRRLLVATSALATLLAGLAGATVTLNYGGMHFSGGTMLGLTALMAAILGGIGSLGGAVAGALVIAALQAAWSATRGIAHWELASFTLLTLALILKPGGFLGYADGAHRKV